MRKDIFRGKKEEEQVYGSLKSPAASLGPRKPAAASGASVSIKDP